MASSSLDPVSPRRTRIGLALHAMGGALLCAPHFNAEALLAFAALLALSTAALSTSKVKAGASLIIGVLTGVVVSTAHQPQWGSLLPLLALTLPAIVAAVGASPRDERGKWLWLRALLLILVLTIGLGFLSDVPALFLAPIALLSHALLRLGVGPLSREPIGPRAVLLGFLAVAACIAISKVTDMRYAAASFETLQSSPLLNRVAWFFPAAPWASFAVFIAFAVAVMRIAPRVSVDGAVVIMLAVAFAIEMRAEDWVNDSILVTIGACLAACTMARRHFLLRVVAAVPIACGAGAISLGGRIPELAMLTLIGSAVAVFIVGVALTKTPLALLLPLKGNVVARSLIDDVQLARVGSLLHAAGLALTVFLPTASLAALIPAVVFATKPASRIATIAAVTAAWIAAPFVAARLFNEGGGDDDAATHAMTAWLPWFVLALVEAVRSRGQSALVLRVGATVGAGLYAAAVLGAGLSPIAAILPGAIVVQALVEKGAGTTQPIPRTEQVSLMIAVPFLAGLTIFEFATKWLVSSDGFWPGWDLHPITLFLIDGGPALVALWLVMNAGIRRAMPFLAPGGAMLAALGVVVIAQKQGHIHELAAVGTALFCVGAVARPALARLLGAWLAAVAACIVFLRTQLPRPDLVDEVGYPLWVVLWFALLVVALVLSDAMRAPPLLGQVLEKPRQPVMQPNPLR